MEGGVRVDTYVVVFSTQNKPSHKVGNSSSLKIALRKKSRQATFVVYPIVKLSAKVLKLKEQKTE
jgi:hypothetical protein